MKLNSVQKIMDLIEQYQASQLFIIAERIGLFIILHKKPLTLDVLAQKLNIPKRGLERLLDALVSLEIVQCIENNKQKKYVATEIAIECFGKEGKIKNWTLHQGTLFKLWANLYEAMKFDKPLLKRTHDIDVEAYGQGLVETYRLSSPKLHEVVSLEGKLRLLDAGGGLGIYSILAALKNPSLKAIIYDREDMVTQANELIKQYSLEKQVFTQVGDLLKDEWPKNQDIVLISNVLHAKSLSESELILSKAFNTLSPNGRVVVKEWVANNNPKIKYFNLTMLLCTKEGRVLNQKEIINLVSSAGFKDLSWLKLNEIEAVLIGYKS